MKDSCWHPEPKCVTYSYRKFFNHRGRRNSHVIHGTGYILKTRFASRPHIFLAIIWRSST